MSLTQLPTEILQAIAQNADRLKLSHCIDLKNLCEVSKQLYDATIPLLYQAIQVRATSSSNKSIVSKLNSIPTKHLKYTKDINFSASFLDRHEMRNGLQISKGETDAWKPIVDRVLSSLVKGKLRSFSWELGPLMDNNLLWSLWGDTGLLASTQEHIEIIRLITTPEFSHHSQNFVNLVRLKNLRSLSWKGLSRYEDFEAIRNCIEQNTSIESLEFHFWDCDYPRQELDTEFGQNRRRPFNCFAQYLLRLQPNESKLVLPSLKNLSLSKAMFYGPGLDIAQALNISQLRTLKLWNCHDTYAWLDSIVDSAQPLQLTTLELVDSPFQFDLYYSGIRITPICVRFLTAFDGLIDLFLMLQQPVDWLNIFDAAYHHHATLKRLVVDNLKMGYSLYY
ncbi:hypothetical protein FQN57_007543 [Myotisia sp. PD_48]|nr:hypothetical protein FQN57_007543 [Myotisia sp. PD_48]